MITLITGNLWSDYNYVGDSMSTNGFSLLPVIATKPEWYDVVPSFLQEPCDIVDLGNPRVAAILSDVIFEMFRTMYATVGVGLAAPQVGIRWQLSVIDTKDPKHYGKGCIILINPEIVDTYESEKVVGGESCLSIPFYNGNIPRHKKIKVKNSTLLGETEFIEAEGFLARVIQHEMDHLKGVLYLQRLRSADDLKIEDGAHITRHARLALEKLKVEEKLQTLQKQLVL